MLNVQVDTSSLTSKQEQAARNHRIIIAANAIVMTCETLEAAAKILTETFGGDLAWNVHTGGSHVALSAKFDSWRASRVILVTEF